MESAPEIQQPEPVQEDIYGNVDEQDNVKLSNAPIQEQISMRRDQAPRFPAHINGALHESSTDIEDEAFYGNSDSIRRGDKVDYVKMKGNVPVDKPRYPPQASSRHPSDLEEQPLYDNDPLQRGIGRHDTVQPRRPPSIPVASKSSTFPSGQINRGYEDDNPEDDYPDYPMNDEERLDSIPDYRPPAPPVSKNRTDGSGAGGHVSELQQKLNSRIASIDDLPSEPPPPVPTSPRRTSPAMSPTGGPPMSELQRVLKSSLQNRNEALRPPNKRPPGQGRCKITLKGLWMV